MDANRAVLLRRCCVCVSVRQLTMWHFKMTHCFQKQCTLKANTMPYKIDCVWLSCYHELVFKDGFSQEIIMFALTVYGVLSTPCSAALFDTLHCNGVTASCQSGRHRSPLCHVIGCMIHLELKLRHCYDLC